MDGFVGLGTVMMQASAVALVMLLFGAVTVRIVRGCLDQSLNGGEAIVLVGATLAAGALTVQAWGTAWMVAPPAVGLGLYLTFHVLQSRTERVIERQHWEQAEEKARALLARDPTAVVGYERLATALEHLGELDEALSVARLWHRGWPSDRDAARLVNRLAGPGAERVVAAPAPAAYEVAAPRAEPLDLGGVPLDEYERPAAPTPRTLSDEEQVAAFSAEGARLPPDEELGLMFDPDAEPEDGDSFS